MMNQAQLVDITLQMIAECEVYDTRSLNAFDNFPLEQKAIVVGALLRELPPMEHLKVITRVMEIERLTKEMVA